MKKVQHDAILKDPEWVADFPIPLEEFGKDFINSLASLQGYKRTWHNNIALRQTANVIRQQILACSSGTIDILELRNPYTKWKKLRK